MKKVHLLVVIVFSFFLLNNASYAQETETFKKSFMISGAGNISYAKASN